MPVTLKPVSEQVIVITGASSGIGLATARAAARKGAHLVLASRNIAVLEEIALDIRKHGGDAIAVQTDVASREDIENVLKQALLHFGRVDTWVNDAGVSIIGRMEDVSEEDHRRLIDTNFWGVVNGSMVAAQYFKHHGGAIINLGSALSDMSIPLQGMYCASKHAVKGFTDSLRMELEEIKAPVSVTLIKPAAIDTPFFEHAKNYTAHEPKAPQPVYNPGEVAHAILHAAANPVRDIHVGSGSKLMSDLRSAAPRLADWIGETFMSRGQLSKKAPIHNNDNLHDMGDDGRIKGEGKTFARPSLYTRTALNPIASAAVAGLGYLAYAYLGNKITNRRAKQLLVAVPIGKNILAKYLASRKVA